MLSWLDHHLDPTRYELTFVGRATGEHFRADPRRRPVSVAASSRDLLRAHDVYLAASLDDPCSNALLEALACGLPAAYRQSGGHPELVGDGGLPFEQPEELPDVLDRLVVGARRATCGDSRPCDLCGRGPVPRGPRARCARPDYDRLVVGDGPVSLVERSRRTACAASTGPTDLRALHDVYYESEAVDGPDWLGAQALKNPLDLWVYQEIMVETRPELIVETGTYRGGSALFLASICELLGTGEVISIDIEPVRDDYPSPSADHVPRRPLVDRSRTSCTRSLAGCSRPGHRHPRLRSLAGARRGRARRVRPARRRTACYVIVEDSNIG